MIDGHGLVSLGVALWLQQKQFMISALPSPVVLDPIISKAFNQIGRVYFGRRRRVDTLIRLNCPVLLAEILDSFKISAAAAAIYRSSFTRAVMGSIHLIYSRLL